MSTSVLIPQPGQIARVRQRHYLVEQTISPKASGDSTLVRMSCVDDDNQGLPLEVLWEREIGPEVLTGEAWESIAKRGFDQPKLFAAYLNTLRWNRVTSTDPRLFQSPFTDINSQGPLGIFLPAKVSSLVEVLADIRRRAVA